ncbi:cation diffusion facilitator family transporter [Falsirhodobacter sp. 20TX0035]|uniref:cation diffusion facilitator family transporter n=1 Tax=Falsirhodobacter sp. 20TX0035 TaxID=3022019 RepID=UPI00232D611F|nr:cation diffusion facilitator family transporter [Falsirhodobacter sp. 20TX0035]MDB6452203.1 cation diffusion facilitator family transporter [Falsirhodobacter sp. 20TX0035]
MSDHARMTLRAGLASILVAGILVALKLWAVSSTGALSIAASLADSAMDLMMSLGAMTALIYAQRPADEDHAFGHSSAEDIAALGQSVFIVISAGVIAVAAVLRLLSPDPHPIAAEGQGIAVMGVSILLTLLLVWWQGRVAQRTGNRVISADRLHYLGDLIPSVGAIVSLMASGPLDLPQIDSVVALAAAVFMVIGAVGIGRGAFDALMDRQADPELLEGIMTLTRNWPEVRGFHDLKSRTAGSRVFIHLHIELDGNLTLREAHDIGAGLKRTITLAYPQTDVIIHKDVADPKV